jgi:phytoene dehydrogenase-like protein
MSSTHPTSDRHWDAIVVGGGHNGLTNAAYLAKAGLRTLVLERRHLVGGAAITEELVPGFSFTTFSYALSLLRPDIIHELNLVEHGFMPLMMPSSFHPTGDGDYLLLGDDHGRTCRRSAATPHTTRTPTTATTTTSTGSARRSVRCSTTRRPTSSARTPRTRPT